MIQSITLNNFQSHKQSKLDFDKGVNVIIGSSNDGKTAILRALNWSVNNRPTGLSLLSYWDRDKDGGSIDGMSCIVSLDNIEILRMRNSRFNGYTIPENTFEAIKTDVPEEITKLFNMSEVNLQKQFDSPFLLSESGAEIARSFNRVIHLDSIDKILANAELQKYRINKSINKNEEELERLDKEIESYSWLSEARIKLDTYKRREKRLADKKDNMAEMEMLLTRVYSYQLQLSNLPINFKPIESMIFESERLDKEINKKCEKYDLLIDTMEKYNKYKSAIDFWGEVEFDKITYLMDSIKLIEENILINKNDYNRLLNYVNDYGDEICRVQKSICEIEKLEKQIPDICPLCNQLLPEKMML